MLIELNKLAIEVGLPESELLTLVTYAGLPRARGCYDDRDVLKLLVKHFYEELYGCAAGDYDPPLRRGPGRGHHHWQKNRRAREI